MLVRGAVLRIHKFWDEIHKLNVVLTCEIFRFLFKNLVNSFTMHGNRFCWLMMWRQRFRVGVCVIRSLNPHSINDFESPHSIREFAITHTHAHSKEYNKALLLDKLQQSEFKYISCCRGVQSVNRELSIIAVLPLFQILLDCFNLSSDANYWLVSIMVIFLWALAKVLALILSFSALFLESLVLKYAPPSPI